MTSIGAIVGSLSGVLTVSKFDIGLAKGFIITALMNVIGMIGLSLTNFHLFCETRPLISESSCSLDCQKDLIIPVCDRLEFFFTKA